MTLAELGAYTLDLPADDYKNIWIKPANDQPSVLYTLNNAGPAAEEYKPDEAALIVTIPSEARQSAETAFLGKIPKSVGSPGGPVYFIAHNDWWEAELPCNTVITVRY